MKNLENIDKRLTEVENREQPPKIYVQFDDGPITCGGVEVQPSDVPESATKIIVTRPVLEKPNDRH